MNVTHDLKMDFMAKTSNVQRVRIRTHCQMTSDQERFHLRHELDVQLNGEAFFAKKQKESIEREAV